MTQITGIGFSNFRVFNKPTFFDLAPISIFTGTNSSGKSSIFKGLLLLNDNADDIEKLKFSGNGHNLGTFVNAKSYISNKDMISFSLGIDNPKGIIFDKFNLELSYASDESGEGAYMLKSTLRNISNQSKASFIEIAPEAKGYFYKFNINIEKILDKLKLEVLASNSSESVIDEDKAHQFIIENGFLFNNRKKKNTDRSLRLNRNSRLDQLRGIDFKIVSIEKLADYLPSFSKEELVPISEIFAQIILTHYSSQEIFLSESRGPIFDDANNYYELYSKYAEKLLKLEVTIAEEQDLFYLFRDQVDNITNRDPYFLNDEKKDHLQNLIFESDPTRYLTAEFIYICRELIAQELVQLAEVLSEKVRKVEYIEAVRANSQRFYTNQSQGTGFNELLLEVGQSWNSLKSIQRKFISDWLQRFHIGDAIKVIRQDGVLSKVIIQKDDREVNLIDLGYGVTQFLPIILKIATKLKHKASFTDFWPQDENTKRVEELNTIIRPSDGPLLLIEEPESNLHPKLQSLLADFFVDVARIFEVTLLIETHSEYFIRRLQVLTADPTKEVKSSDTVIYYLDGNIPSGSHGFVKKINIEPDGSLTNEFGSGFIDEATNWKIELMRLKNSHLYNTN